MNPLRFRIRRPADLLAAVPYLLGFHPADSVVAVCMSADRLSFVARADLPPVGEPPEDLAGYLAGVVARQGVHGVVLVGYGPPARVEPALFAVRDAIAVDVYDVLRVTDDHYWSYTCADPDCCPPTGTPFDVSTSEVAATAAYAGAVALPDREALVARLAPVRGGARESMRRATVRARRRLGGLADAAAVMAAGEAAAREAVQRHRAGGALSDDEVAWLTVLLEDVPVRDRVWTGVTEPELHVDLWTDVVRRADPDLVAGPASLLAFAAWRAGVGSLAVIAVQRALDADPSYSMALLLEELLHTGTPPSILDGWPRLGQPPRRRRRRPARAVRA